MNGLSDLLLSVPEALFWPALLALFLLFVVGLWCAITLMTALVGWRDLARDYATTAAPHGQPFYALVGSVGLASYKGLNAWAAPEGLFLTAPWLLRLGHKPLLIPWKHIRNMKITQVLGARVAHFNITGITMKLPARVIEAQPATG